MKKLMMTMMAAVRAVQRPVLTMVAEQPQTITTSMAVTSDQAPTDKN